MGPEPWRLTGVEVVSERLDDDRRFEQMRIQYVELVTRDESNRLCNREHAADEAIRGQASGSSEVFACRPMNGAISF